MTRQLRVGANRGLTQNCQQQSWLIIIKMSNSQYMSKVKRDPNNLGTNYKAKLEPVVGNIKRENVRSSQIDDISDQDEDHSVQVDYRPVKKLRSPQSEPLSIQLDKHLKKLELDRADVQLGSFRKIGELCGESVYKSKSVSLPFVLKGQLNKGEVCASQIQGSIFQELQMPFRTYYLRKEQGNAQRSFLSSE